MKKNYNNDSLNLTCLSSADSPGSAVLRAGDYAYIGYYILAKIDKKAWRNTTLKVPFVILPTRPVPMPQLLAPIVDRIDPMPIYKAKCCCFTCGQAGTVEIKLSLSRRAFAPGEKIDLSGSEVVNDSTIPVTARVVLRQTIMLCSTSMPISKSEQSDRFELGTIIVAPQSSSSLGSLDITAPALPPSFFGARGLLVRGKTVEPLTFAYELSLQAKAQSGHKVKLDTPILLSAVPPKAEVINDMASAPSLLRFDNLFEIQTYSVCDDTPSETVVMTTGLEDVGAVVPAESGGGNIYNPEEDSGSSFNAYPYNPQVVVFSPDTNQTEEIPPPAIEVSHDAAYRTLIATMESEFDSRLAVDRWIKEYPSAAATLTEDEFAGVLKKVLLSMEQGAVARELVSGIGSGVLTTQYIVAAMEACPFSKLMLVTTMAPYVSDPENKEVVLSQLYSYERNDAARAFTV